MTFVPLTCLFPQKCFCPVKCSLYSLFSQEKKLYPGGARVANPTSGAYNKSVPRRSPIQINERYRRKTAIEQIEK